MFIFFRAPRRLSSCPIDYQDVIAIGNLFLRGEVDTSRVISVSGPAATNPEIIRTARGADIEAITAGNQAGGENRLISGAVLGGRGVQAHSAYLGRYHNQVSILSEGRDRIFMGWLAPGTKKHSAMGIYLSSLFGRKPLAMTTTTNGSERAMVPVGAYERVMPLDVLPTQLLRALLVGDTETAQALGCLELDEEDLALCTYVCRENMNMVQFCETTWRGLKEERISRGITQYVRQS